jgi:hypothetical protein
MKVEVTDIVPVLPAGVHPAAFASITEETNDSGTYFLWTFNAADPETGELVDMTGTTSPKITPRTKASKWLAGMGVEIEVGGVVDFDALVGTPVQLVIIINEAGYSRIDNVLPPAKKAAK